MQFIIVAIAPFVLLLLFNSVQTTKILINSTTFTSNLRTIVQKSSLKVPCINHFQCWSVLGPNYTCNENYHCGCDLGYSEKVRVDLSNSNRIFTACLANKKAEPLNFVESFVPYLICATVLVFIFWILLTSFYIVLVNYLEKRQKLKKNQQSLSQLPSPFPATVVIIHRLYPTQSLPSPPVPPLSSQTVTNELNCYSQPPSSIPPSPQPNVKSLPVIEHHPYQNESQLYNGSIFSSLSSSSSNAANTIFYDACENLNYI